MTEQYVALYVDGNDIPAGAYSAEKAEEIVAFLEQEGIEGLYTVSVSEQ